MNTTTLSTHAQSEHKGAHSRENAPQVVVRAGKHFVCTACGTLVEIPADVVGKLVLAAAPASREEAVEESPAEQSAATAPSEPPPAVKQQMPPEAPRSKPPKPFTRTCPPSQMADGLVVPSAKQLDRATAWVGFHEKMLGRQGSEFYRLRKRLRQHRRQDQCAPATVHSNDDRTVLSSKHPAAMSLLAPLPEETARSTPASPMQGPPLHPRLLWTNRSSPQSQAKRTAFQEGEAGEFTRMVDTARGRPGASISEAPSRIIRQTQPSESHAHHPASMAPVPRLGKGREPP